MRKPCYMCLDAASHVLGCPVADLPETYWAVCTAQVPTALPSEYVVGVDFGAPIPSATVLKAMGYPYDSPYAYVKVVTDA